VVVAVVVAAEAALGERRSTPVPVAPIAPPGPVVPLRPPVAPLRPIVALFRRRPHVVWHLAEDPLTPRLGSVTRSRPLHKTIGTSSAMVAAKALSPPPPLIVIPVAALVAAVPSEEEGKRASLIWFLYEIFASNNKKRPYQTPRGNIRCNRCS
jgi:hypothetical protein